VNSLGKARRANNETLVPAHVCLRELFFVNKACATERLNSGIIDERQREQAAAFGLTNIA